MSARLLLVDDEASLLDFLSLLFQEEGYEVATADSTANARETLASSSFDLVLCDITMPDGSGLDLLREIKQDAAERTAVIMMTAYTSTESAIEAMKLGAYDYVSKPFDVEELRLLVRKALEKIELYDENRHLRRELQGRYTFANIIGRSSRMQAVFHLIEKVAKTPSTVLIQGESGTGKELIARAIHYNSNRATGRFLSINCGALPESLLESELFGHERGAFTGAVREKSGLFQEAEGGTLFLDEIGEMSLSMQVKLLRALQEKVVRKVGGTREEPVDARIITASNRNLKDRVADGSMREDLFYRIHVIPIELPPLRQRREDIPLLVNHFVDKYARATGADGKRFSVEAMKLLEAYEWPGNVRELENVVERTLALCPGTVVTATDLPGYLRAESPNRAIIDLPEEGLDLERLLDDLRAQLMHEALDRADGVQTRAAELLGMTFRSFRYYARKAGLVGSGAEASSRRDDG
jgi:two-component system response regulator PilR (NtrC family)